VRVEFALDLPVEVAFVDNQGAMVQSLEDAIYDTSLSKQEGTAYPMISAVNLLDGSEASTPRRLDFQRKAGFVNVFSDPRKRILTEEIETVNISFELVVLIPEGDSGSSSEDVVGSLSLLTDTATSELLLEHFDTHLQNNEVGVDCGIKDGRNKGKLRSCTMRKEPVSQSLAQLNEEILEANREDELATTIVSETEGFEEFWEEQDEIAEQEWEAEVAARDRAKAQATVSTSDETSSDLAVRIFANLSDFGESDDALLYAVWCPVFLLLSGFLLCVCQSVYRRHCTRGVFGTEGNEFDGNDMYSYKARHTERPPTPEKPMTQVHPQSPSSMSNPGGFDPAQHPSTPEGVRIDMTDAQFARGVAAGFQSGTPQSEIPPPPRRKSSRRSGQTRNGSSRRSGSSRGERPTGVEQMHRPTAPPQMYPSVNAPIIVQGRPLSEDHEASRTVIPGAPMSQQEAFRRQLPIPQYAQPQYGQPQRASSQYAQPRASAPVGGRLPPSPGGSRGRRSLR
jgi:hypothetical protein